jgi:hypothetical protein
VDVAWQGQVGPSPQDRRERRVCGATEDRIGTHAVGYAFRAGERSKTRGWFISAKKNIRESGQLDSAQALIGSVTPTAHQCDRDQAPLVCALVHGNRLIDSSRARMIPPRQKSPVAHSARAYGLTCPSPEIIESAP